jgi:hypothetical protein
MTDIYPREFCVGDSLPNSELFAIAPVNGVVGKGVRAKVRFPRGTLLARFTGILSGAILQHTLQVSPDLHLHDPYFVGLLSHSCSPNCSLEMARLEVWSLVDIEADSLLTIDYAATEDVLFRQFPCNCGSKECRRWITGRREGPNAEGRAYLDALAQGKVGTVGGRKRS